MTDELVKRRKDHHIDVCLDEDVGAVDDGTGLGGFTLEYDALPEVDLDDVDVSCELLGKRLRSPIIIGAMTGGTERAGRLNRILARAAAAAGVGMALGSQRAMLVAPDTTPSFQLRKFAPELPLLFGNIGAVQLNYGVGVDDIVRLVETVEADALNFHLNPLQEAVQPEGDTRFAGLRKRLSKVIPQIPVPCLAKEVGSGLSARTARKLSRLPLVGVEVAGVGGTSWARVESSRAAPTSLSARIGERLSGFGVPTAPSIVVCRKAFEDGVVIASGGIRTGMDIAVALALGADGVALARPFLEAAARHDDEDEAVAAVVDALALLTAELRTIAFCTGAASLEDLRRVNVIPEIGED